MSNALSIWKFAATSIATTAKIQQIFAMVCLVPRIMKIASVIKTHEGRMTNKTSKILSFVRKIKDIGSYSNQRIIQHKSAQ